MGSLKPKFKRIGVDLLGSDKSQGDLLSPALIAAKLLPQNTGLLLFVTKIPHEWEELKKSLDEEVLEKIDFHVVSEEITMQDDPLVAIRHKKDSSIIQALRLLKKKRIEAFVSCGNTGALVAASTLILNKINGVRRAALLAVLPSKHSHVSILDVGGNLSLKPSDLLAFAELGSLFEMIQYGRNNPKVGLLNIGVESKKGTEIQRETFELLKNSSLNFIGNCEPREVFEGRVDVVVTEGYSGNILLKTAEGVAHFFLDYLKELPKDSDELYLKLKKNFSYKEYPGALLMGVEGVVVKCHGDSSKESIISGIMAASQYVERALIQSLVSFPNK